MVLPILRSPQALGNKPSSNPKALAWWEGFLRLGLNFFFKFLDRCHKWFSPPSLDVTQCRKRGSNSLPIRNWSSKTNFADQYITSKLPKVEWLEKEDFLHISFDTSNYDFVTECKNLVDDWPNADYNQWLFKIFLRKLCKLS